MGGDGCELAFGFGFFFFMIAVVWRYEARMELMLLIVRYIN